MRRSLCAAFVAAMCAVAATVNAQYVNDNVQRTVEFQGPVVREQRAMAVVLDEAAGKEHVPPPYIVAVEVFHPNTTISHVAVKDKKSGRALEVTPTPVVGQAASVVANGAPSSRRVQLYAVRLPDNAKERTSIVVDIVYNHGLVPYPRAIAQRDRQLVEYRANVYVPSPYVTRKQRLKVTYVRGCGCVCGCVWRSVYVHFLHARTRHAFTALRHRLSSPTPRARTSIPWPSPAAHSPTARTSVTCPHTRTLNSTSIRRTTSRF